MPDHSTISQLRRRKPSFRKVFRRLFEEVVRQCIEKGLASGRLVGTDSTHVRANASRASEELVEIQEEAGAYWVHLDEYEEEGLEELKKRTGKRRVKRTKQVKPDNRRTKKRVSRTVPEAGYMNRPEKPRWPHYLSHQLVDIEHGIILDVRTTLGDAYDSVPYLDQIERVHWDVLTIQKAAADAAYDFPLAHRVLEDMGVNFCIVPHRTHDRTETELKRADFAYDEARDLNLCPNGKELHSKSLHRSASGLTWEYMAKREDCENCPLWEKCLRENDRRGVRKLEDSYFRPSVQWHLKKRNDPGIPGRSA